MDTSKNPTPAEAIKHKVHQDNMMNAATLDEIASSLSSMSNGDFTDNVPHFRSVMAQTLTKAAAALRDTEGQLNAVKSERDTALAKAEQHRQDAARKQGQIDRMHKDFQLIDARLTEEAEDRDWCSEYDDIIEGLNNNMSVLQITPRKRAWRGELTINLDISARDEGEAERILGLAERFFDGISASTIAEDVEWVAVRNHESVEEGEW